MTKLQESSCGVTRMSALEGVDRPNQAACTARVGVSRLLAAYFLLHHPPVENRSAEPSVRSFRVGDRDQRDFARNLRKQMSEADKRLWQLLRAQQLQGHKFRRQAAIGPYVVDFVCLSHKLIVELDGPHHDERNADRHDARRSAWLASRGFSAIRFWNHELDDEIRSVMESIGRAPRPPWAFLRFIPFCAAEKAVAC